MPRLVNCGNKHNKSFCQDWVHTTRIKSAPDKIPHIISNHLLIVLKGQRLEPIRTRGLIRTHSHHSLLNFLLSDLLKQSLGTFWRNMRSKNLERIGNTLRNRSKQIPIENQSFMLKNLRIRRPRSIIHERS